MRNRYWRVIMGLLCLLLLCSTLSCGGGDTSSLPPVVTKGLNQDEPVIQTTKTGGFTIDIHKTYAEIKSYEGTDTVLTLPDSVAGVSVKMIGESAFAGDEKLTKVYLPAGTLVIDRYAFDGCKNLTEVIFNDELEVIDDYAFRDSGLITLSLPDTVATIGKYSFYRTRIDALTIPANVSKLGKYAFYGCQNLTSITFCPRLSEIGEYVFYECTALQTLVIPETVTKLADYCFRSCTSLTRVFLPAATESIGTGVFVDCPSLVIYTPAGSSAERAAKRNGYAYVTCESAEAMPSEG